MSESTVKQKAPLTWNHVEKSPRVSYVDTLLQKVFEGNRLLSVLLLKVTPGQVAMVEQVDQDVEDRLHVVAARLVVASARVKRREEKVARELVQVLFCNVLVGWLVDELLREPEVD
jgi:hypothetical protein